MRNTAAAYIIVLASTASAQTTTSTGMAAWKEDLRIIAEQLPARHPDLFYRMSRAKWDSAIASLDARLPTLTKNAATVALMQLVALPKDGHTSINPLFDPAMEMHYLPVELFVFDDGLYIKSASPAWSSLVGSKVIRIGQADANDAIAAVATTFGHENEWWARAWAPTRLVIAEVLQGLGITSRPDEVTMVVERNGTRQTVTLPASQLLKPRGHNPAGAFDRSGWIDMRAPGAAPAWLRNPGLPYFVEFLPADSTLYVGYRAVITYDENPNPQFWRKVFAAADSLPVKRFVLDIRDNSGGESFFNRQVVRGIVARPALDRADRLFVITGGKTFSAAMNLALDLERWTNATFVGEPTGNATVFFGDHEQIKLPVSGMTVNVSTLPWYPDSPRDKRPFLAPRLFTPLASSEYRMGIDPAMREIAKSATRPSIAERVEAAIMKGDSAGALTIIREAAADPLNRFRSPEAEVNALGYRLLPANRPAAISVFALNTRVFPESANTWDSFGEALLADGQRDEAIAAYRKALAIDPQFPSALAALRRLH